MPKLGPSQNRILFTRRPKHLRMGRTKSIHLQFLQLVSSTSLYSYGDPFRGVLGTRLLATPPQSRIREITGSLSEEAGWSPEMDELARQPKHGPHYAQLLHLLNEMQNHQSAWPFQKPVSQDEVPDYYNVITEPMDLETMEKRLEEDAYSSPEEFIRDAKLIFNNCRRYNNESTSYWKNANKLEKFMNQKLKEIPEWSVSVSLELSPHSDWRGRTGS